MPTSLAYHMRVTKMDAVIVLATAISAVAVFGGILHSHRHVLSRS